MTQKDLQTIKAQAKTLSQIFAETVDKEDIARAQRIIRGWNLLLGSPRLSLVDQREKAWPIFIDRLSQRHSSVIACHAAVDAFVIENQVVHLLAVLLEKHDNKANFDTRRNATHDFLFHMTQTPLPDGSPMKWNHLKASVSSVSDPRMKSALWTFAALPDQSHIPNDPASSFRWLKQSWIAVPGSSNIMNVASGDSAFPLPRTHELRGRLTHPANASNIPKVIETMDNEYLTAIQDDCEDWVIALFDQVELVASLFPELYLPTLRANLQYMSETLQLEVEAFHKAGLVSCPHYGGDPNLCSTRDIKFLIASMHMQNSCDELMQSMISVRRKFPSKYQRRLARQMGQYHHVFRHAYGFLKKFESDRYHSVTFPGLSRLRAELSSKAGGIIWNYLKPNIKDRSASYRLSNPL